MKYFARSLVLLGLILAIAVVAGCGSSPATPQSGAPTSQPGTPATAAGKVTLILGAYTTPQEAYGKIIPLFKKMWKDKTGQDVEFQESYLGSGAQARAIVNGFEADIAALSLAGDIQTIVKAGLITHDWTTKGTKGMVSDSVVVLAVRKGNPKGIKDWNDLTQKGLDILTPDPKTSGGAQWNIMAMYGAAKRGFVTGVTKDDDQAAQGFVKNVLKNVSVLDKGARESITNYEKGVGDVAITYENEAIVGRQAGQTYDYIIPRSTILIENPIAVVDKNVDKHGTRVVAEAFRDFLFTKDIQRVFAQYGLRSVDPTVAQETKGQYPDVQDLFPIDYFGGWSQVTQPFFGNDGIYSKLMDQVQQEKGQ
ncbi:MAG: sulfate ABC transporter substrate-binding protein [Anaerolineae bacterium]